MATKRTAQQVAIAETQSRKNKAIETAASDYVEKRDERMSWGEEEKKAKEKLIAAMKKAGEEHYETEDWLIDLTVKDPTESVKVKARNVEEEAAE